DVNLPTADANIQETVASYMQTELERNRQVLSLMVLSSFTTPAELREGTDPGGGSSGIAGGATLLSNWVSGTLNNWIGQTGVDLDVKLEVNPQDVKLQMAKQIANNRWTIETNIGRTTASTAQANSLNATQWLGDANVEYKITPDGRVRMRAFSRSNEDNILNQANAPFTHGAGISYRQEFDNLAELRARNKERRQIKREERKNK
ncbi:MAG TPA: translocation/assembly module TamB domain-containing protein, partial [Bacteroidia bacterium]|nr:translocation/assembly module TamB domain-containing protein [Bacteroidia bacterium]